MDYYFSYAGVSVSQKPACIILTPLNPTILYSKTGFYRGIQPASVAQLDTPSDWRPGGRGFNPRRGR